MTLPVVSTLVHWLLVPLMTMLDVKGVILVQKPLSCYHSLYASAWNYTHFCSL